MWLRKICASLWKFSTLFKAKIEAKKMHHAIFHHSQWLNPYVNFQTKKNRSRKNDEKHGKALHKLIHNTMQSKTETMENLRNRINVRLKNTAQNGHQNQTWCHKTYLRMIYLQYVKVKLN